MLSASFLTKIIRVIVPKRIIHIMMDRWESFKRFMPRKQVGIPKYGIGPTQVYPQGTNFYSVLQVATKQKLINLDITSTTQVASIGSCFAELFAFFFKDSGSYVCTEEAFGASANWGRVTSFPNFLQVVRYSVESNYPVIIEQCKQGWFDPLRESRVGKTYFGEKAEARESILMHRRAAYKAFSTCEVLIITIGQNEVWIDTRHDQVWAKRPPQEILDLRSQEFLVTEFNFEKNKVALQSALELLFSINPKMKCLFTISPVPAHATFSDMDIVSRSFANKCLLRAVVDEVVRSNPGRLFYFPSFEMVFCNNPYSFRADNRHVKHKARNNIFSMLMKSTRLESTR